MKPVLFAFALLLSACGGGGGGGTPSTEDSQNLSSEIDNSISQDASTVLQWGEAMWDQSVWK